MKKSHIAFLNVPRRPHVNPTLPIVASLVRRGHHVTYVTSDVFARRVSALGAEIVCCPRHPPLGRAKYENPFIELAARSLNQLGSFYRKNRPDLMIYDGLFFAGRILANRLKTRTIQTTPCLDIENAADYKLQTAESSEFQSFLREENGAEEYFSKSGAPYRGALNIFLYPRLFQLNADASDETCFYAGRCAGEQLPEGQWSIGRCERRPIVLVSMSSTYRQKIDYFRTCIGALDGLGWRVVLSIGEENDPTDIFPLPENFEVIQNVSHGQVLRYADLYIYMGGMIATAEAAYYGVPSIFIQRQDIEELRLYGQISVSLGISTCVDQAEDLAGRIRETALRVVNDSIMRARVRDVQRAVRSEAGGEETANIIEDYLESRWQAA